MTPRKSITRRSRKRPDLRQLANVANADTASIATALALLLEAERQVVIDVDTRNLIVTGIKNKCTVACATLQAIDKALDGGK